MCSPKLQPPRGRVGVFVAFFRSELLLQAYQVPVAILRSIFEAAGIPLMQQTVRPPVLQVSTCLVCCLELPIKYQRSFACGNYFKRRGKIHNFLV